MEHTPRTSPKRGEGAREFILQALLEGCFRQKRPADTGVDSAMHVGRKGMRSGSQVQTAGSIPGKGTS